MYRIDDYTLPSLMIKLLKAMKKNQVCEMTTNRVDKLRTNFKSKLFDQYSVFKEGDTVKITITLLGIDHLSYFYKYKVAEKLAYVQRLKGIAGEFFKAGNFKKAAKVYQKVNGFYNFGDVANNYAKEEEDEEFKKTHAELVSLKIICFTNLVVCKFKTSEY